MTTPTKSATPATMIEEVEERAAEAAPGPTQPLVTSLARTFLICTLGVDSFLLTLLQLVWGETDAKFFLTNQMGIKARLVFFGVAALLSASLGVLALVFSLRRTEPGVARLQISTLAAPFVVSAFVPLLFSQDAWRDRQVAYLCYLLAVGLALERLGRPAWEVLGDWFARASWKPHWTAFSARPFGRWACLGLVVLLATAYFVRIGHLTNVSHIKLMTMSSDLAEYDNLFFNALHGHPFRSPAIAGHLNDWNTLQGHAEFGLYLLLPFYALSPGAHALLWIQSALVGATAIPLFLLARARLGSLAGLCFAVAYLMMPSVQQPNFYDFHFTPLGMFFVSWLFVLAIYLAGPTSARWHRTALYSALVLALLCREDISIGIAVLGLYLVLSGVLVRDGLVLAGVSVVYFVSMKFGIMPLFGRWWFDNMYDEIKAPGAQGFGAVIVTLASNPSFVLRGMLTEPKFLYVLHMTVPLLALWLRRPLLWLAFLPGFVSTLLVTNRPPMFQSSFQYTYFWVPYVVGASILATRRGVRGGGTLVALLLVAASLSHQLGVFPRGERILGGFSYKTFDVSPAEQRRYEQLTAIIAKIPTDATVTVTEAEGPHVSTRLVMYSLKYTLGPSPDYLLINHPGHRSEADHLREALASGKYGVVERSGPFVLARRGADPAKNDVLWRKVGGRPTPSRGKPAQP